MGPRSRSVATLPGRALLAPASTRTAGYVDDNVNNLSANSTVRCKVGLEPLTDAGRGELQAVDARLPNWLRVVLHAVGTNHDIGPQLPASIEVPVLLEAGTERIVSMDVEATAAELARYRELGRREWLETEAVLAPVRGVVKLPGAAIRGARGLLTSWRDAFADKPASDLEAWIMTHEVSEILTAEEAAALRRDAGLS